MQAFTSSQVHSSAKHYLWFRSLSNTIVLST